MATLIATLRSAVAHGKLRAHFAGKFRAFKQAADEKILRRHTEAVLRSHDRRVLLDLGIENQEQEIEPENRQSKLSTLRLLFSWTRFAK
jgi:2C-methyl-D-erythritol 2,4-cyclodiphosphate synthase